MEKQWKIDVRLTANDIFWFLINHGFSTWQGKVTWGLGILALIGAPVMLLVVKDNFTAIIFLLVAIMYLLVTPLSLYSNAKRQMISNSVFKNKIVFTLYEEMLQIKQYTGEVKLFWTQMEKIEITRHFYFLYVNGRQAFIIPKRSIEEIDAKDVATLLLDKQAQISKGSSGQVPDEKAAEESKEIEVSPKTGKEKKPIKDRSFSSDKVKSFQMESKEQKKTGKEKKESEPRVGKEPILLAEEPMSLSSAQEETDKSKKDEKKNGNN
ncbi:hypothetical protein EII17_09845 [Clostridiales bacterium COT073_COT-073]|nr:hypothetical protein EII17_09845 [Clostridiales bacterium COT073_COT-073]